MKTQFVFLLAAMSFLVLSCDPCPEGFVKVSEDTETYPELSWTVEIGSRANTSIGTALTLYTDPTTTITLSGNDTAWIKFEARDAVNGIKSIDVEGGYGITCSSDTTAISANGIFPPAPETNTLSDGCGPVSHTFAQEFIITATGQCGSENPNLTSAAWELRGQATNFQELISGSVLQINWTP
jgi:hypothetical protein